MKWTTEPPTQTGWYWMGNSTGNAVVQVKHRKENGGYFSVVCGAVELDVNLWKATGKEMYWAGPIEEPEDEMVN